MSTSTHPVGPEEVMALLDGELSPDREAVVSTHLGTCMECSAVAEGFGKVSARIQSWEIGQVPASLTKDAVPKLAESAKRKSVLGRVANWRPASPLHWVVIAGSGVATLVLLFAIATPNLLRSKMAANEAVAYRQWIDQHPGKTFDDFYAERMRGMRAGDAVTAQPAGRMAGKVTRSGADKAATSFGNTELESFADEGERSGPMITRTVSLSIVVKDFDAGRAALDAILTRHNGYAASLNVSTPQSTARTLQASLRIPAPQLASAMSELKALGRVENETQNGEEVTQEHADLLARLKNSRETEQRLQDVLRTRTGKVKDVLEVEEEIARVRGEIEQMEAEQKTLEHRVDFATIDLKLAEEYKAQLNTPAPSVLMQLRNATVNGFRNAFESLLALVLFLAESGPSLLLWLVLLGIPVWRLWRRYRRAQSLGSLA